MAIIRASMVFVNKEVWKTFLERRAVIRKRESGKRKNKENLAAASLKKKQLTVRDQCIELIEEEFTKKMGITSSGSQTLFAGGFN